MTFSTGGQAINNGSGADRATAVGINRKTFYVGSSAPSFTVDGVTFPEKGTLWLDTSTDPPTPRIYDSATSLWVGYQLSLSQATYPTVDAKYFHYNTTTSRNHYARVNPDRWVAFQDGGVKYLNETFAGYPGQAEADAAWVSSDTAKMRANVTNGNLDFDIVADNTDDHVYHDLGAVLSDTAWVLRFKLRFSTATAGNRAQIPIVLSSTTGAQNTNQDFIGFIWSWSTGAWQWGAIDGDATTVSIAVNDDAQSRNPATATDYYVEIARTSPTTYTVKMFSDSAYTTQLDATSDGTCASTVVRLRYIKICNAVVSTTGQMVGTIDDVKFYDGVTSV